MRIALFAAAVAVAAVSSLASAQILRPGDPDPAEKAAQPPKTSIESPKAGAAEAKKERDGPKTYVPGLEQFMGVMQNQHIKLWFAARAGNWALAAYQLGEIKEVMGDIQDLIPTFRSQPMDQMLDAVITGQIVDLERIIDTKDTRSFAGGFDKLTDACNACHQAFGNNFIVIQRPTTNPFTNQKFDAPR